MLSAIKAIIFDHDGTLVDSEPVHFACWNEVLARYDSRFEFQDYCTHLNGLPSIESAKWIIRHCQLTVAPDALYAQKQVEVERYLADKAFPLMEGARALVEEVATAGYALALASGAGRLEVTHSLSSHGLDKFFTSIATKNDVVNNKPAPDVYLLAAQQLGVAPGHALAIEDSDAGQTSALAAGMFCFRLNTTATIDDSHPRLRVFRSLDAMKMAIDTIKR